MPLSPHLTLRGSPWLSPSHGRPPRSEGNASSTSRFFKEMTLRPGMSRVIPSVDVASRAMALSFRVAGYDWSLPVPINADKDRRRWPKGARCRTSQSNSTRSLAACAR